MEFESHVTSAGNDAEKTHRLPMGGQLVARRGYLGVLACRWSELIAVARLKGLLPDGTWEAKR